MTRFLGVCAVAFVAWTASSRAEVRLVGLGTIPGDARDLSGLKGAASDGTPHDRLGGLGSAIAYTGKGDEYILACDRGPKDGASDFACRVHRMTITVTPGATKPVTLKLTATQLLIREDGQQFVGALDAFTHNNPAANLRLDPEGIRIGRDGTLFIADEYGPLIYAFDSTGKRVRSLPVPDRFRVPKPGKSPADELPPKTTRGRQPNRGLEGLAISPDGTKLYGAMQSPLIQDGGVNSKNERTGVNCRILEVEIATGTTREFVYPLDSPANGVCEILAVSPTTFLVLERDSLSGKSAAFKKVFLIDIAGATDISSVDALPAGALPPAVMPVKKKLFLDLLANQHRIAGPECPEKFEGLAFGPNLPDGRHLLLVTVDNDFLAEQPLRVYAFAIDQADLPEFKPQQFPKK